MTGWTVICMPCPGWSTAAGRIGAGVYAMNEKQNALPPLRRGMAVAAVGLILLFSILYPLARLRPGLEYGDDLLYSAGSDGVSTVYSGRVDGAWAVLTVSADGAITYQWDGTEYGPYTTRLDPAAAPEGELSPFLTGVELFRGDEMIFRGGWLEDVSVLLDESGAPVFYTSSDGVPYNSEDEALDPHEPRIEFLLSLSLGQPELVRRGEPLFWLLGTFAAGLALTQIFFADRLFRHQMSFYIRDPERAAPSDWELARRVLAPLVLLIIALIAYLVGLSIL